MTKLVRTGSFALVLAFTFFLGLLFVIWPRMEDAVLRNMAALGMVQTWKAEPVQLYRMTCAQNEQEILSSPSDSLAQEAANDQQALVQLARNTFFSGNCQDALFFWTQVLQNDPRNRSAAVMQYLSSGLDSAYFPTGLSFADMSNFLYRLGLQAERNQARNQAQYWFAHSFELQPSRQVADQLLAFQIEPHQEASIWRSLADTLTEDDPDYWWALGQNFEIEKEWDRALWAYAKGASISPAPYNFLIRQGELHKQRAAWDSAQKAFQQASVQRPREITPYLELGHIYRQQGDFENAKEWYAKALARFPENFSVNYFLGLTHYQLEDDLLAEKYLLRAVELKPQHAASAYYLAQTLERNGDSQKALEYLEMAVQLQEEKSWRWLSELGDWRKKAGDVQGALAAYKEGLALQQDNATLLNKVRELEPQP
jgi:tetratricopeptide (TPR) repeat protein